jgi:hypothetical protein
MRVKASGADFLELSQGVFIRRRVARADFFNYRSASNEVVFPDVFFRFFHETHGESVGRERLA